MTADRGADSDAVRAELDEWVDALSHTIDRLYAEIDRIRRGELKPLRRATSKEDGDAADRGSAGGG